MQGQLNCLDCSRFQMNTLTDPRSVCWEAGDATVRLRGNRVLVAYSTTVLGVWIAFIRMFALHDPTHSVQSGGSGPRRLRPHQ